ncbi:MAG: ATP-grasp domain-containing protein [Lysobacterales bacterium]|nr:MAG: ATP-grasp domain-containing protein [Xanthomonadales bacterium]
MTKTSTRKKLKVIMLADESLLPAGDLKDYSEKQRELRKTEFDVRDAIGALGHEVISIGVSDDLSTIRGAIDAHKPDIAFNLVEEFDGIGHFDQHVVSYLELRRQAYTGCNPRGLTLARDKALTKKILAYHGLKVPEFAIFAKRRVTKRPESLAFPLFVKSLTEEGSVGISGASIVRDDEKLMERVRFIHRTTNSTALAEQFIEGREIYVGVMGNDRVTVLPPWEFVMTKKEDGAPLIASDRAKWDPEYQRQVGLKTGPARLSKKMQAKLADLSKEIYRLLGMSGYARLDYRVTQEGDAYLLEANPNPQIAKDEDFALSAKHVGIDYPELIEQLIQFGMKYVPSRMIA